MDESKLVPLVTEALKRDEDAVAWSWMYTGKSLLPKSYKLERLQLKLQLGDGAWASAAASISAMFELFPPSQHPEWATLLVEIVVTALQEKTLVLDADVSAFTRVYRELVSDQRHRMIKHAIAHAAAQRDSTLECRLHAFLLASFPELVATEGERMVDRVLDISEEAIAIEGLQEILRAVLQSDHLQLNKTMLGDGAGSITFLKAKGWVMRAIHLCVKENQWQAAFTVFLYLWQQCGMAPLDVSAAQLGTPASSPDAKMAEELNRVIGLADAAAGGPQQQLGDALKALYFYKVCAQYMSCTVIRGGMTPTGSSGTLVEDAAIQRESEDAPVITIVHCPPYVSSAVTSFNDTLDVAAEEAKVCNCTGDFCKCPEDGGGGGKRKRTDSCLFLGSEKRRDRGGEGEGASSKAGADSMFVDDASHGRVMAAQPLLAAAASVWQLVCGDGSGAADANGKSQRLPPSVANFFTGTSGGGSGSGGVSLGGSGSQKGPVFDPLWLAVLSTDVALSRRAYADAYRYASDVVSLCERFPNGMVGGGREGRGSAAAPNHASNTTCSGARSPLVVGVTVHAIVTIKLRGLLQRTSAMVALGNLDEARLLAMRIFGEVPTTSGSAVRQILCDGLSERIRPALQHGGSAHRATLGSGGSSGVGDDSGSNLKLIPCLPSHLVSCAFELMMPSYEAETINSGLQDAHVARLLTLYQYEWPRYQSGFEALLEWIGDKQSFSFIRFFHYIANVDYAEEFMYLANTSKVKLMLTKSSITETAAPSRKSTRGGSSKERGELVTKLAIHVGGIIDADASLSHCLAQFIDDESKRLLQPSNPTTASA